MAGIQHHPPDDLDRLLAATIVAASNTISSALTIAGVEGSFAVIITIAVPDPDPDREDDDDLARLSVGHGGRGIAELDRQATFTALAAATLQSTIGREVRVVDLQARDPEMN